MVGQTETENFNIAIILLGDARIILGWSSV